MFNRPPSSRKQDATALAGWLFADLLLGLSMIFLVSAPISTRPEPTPVSAARATALPTPAPSATAPPTATPTPLPAPTPVPTATSAQTGPPGLSEAQCYNLELGGTDSADGSETQAVISQLTSQLPNDANIRVGLVIVWAHGQDVQDGANIAGRVNDALKSSFSSSFGGSTKRKSLGFRYGAYKHAQVEIYLYTTSPWQSGREVACEYVQ